MKAALKTVLSVILLTTMAATAAARDYQPDEITNPNLANRYEYVADPENMLGQATRNIVNRRLQALRDSTTAEVAVAIVPSIGDYTIEDFSEKVFTEWGLGKEDKDNGVLLLISPESRQVRIQTGYGAEGVLPDITCSHIIDTAVVPNMREDNLDAAVDDATAMISEIMTNPEYAEELRSKLADNYSGFDKAPLDEDDVWQLLIGMLCIVWLASMALYLYDTSKSKRLHAVADRALLWKGAMNTQLVLGIFSLLTAIPFYLLSRRNYRRTRYGSHTCPNCGGKTHLLTGKEALAHLTPAQQCEVKLGSMEYDVHKCDKCGNIEVAGFLTENSEYTQCPQCGTRAYHSTGESRISDPTYSCEGLGVRHFKCEYCGHGEDKYYDIPKKDMSGAIAAAAILGAASRGGRGGGGGFGGGNFGGGFGGGMTGGGGASGRW